MIRTTVLFRGHVQGVGFRATASFIASSFDVTGYVRNLPDGRVELVAEGTAPEISAFLAAVQDRLGSHIEDHTRDDQPITAETRSFHDFSIRY